VVLRSPVNAGMIRTGSCAVPADPCSHHLEAFVKTGRSCKAAFLRRIRLSNFQEKVHYSESVSSPLCLAACRKIAARCHQIFSIFCRSIICTAIIAESACQLHHQNCHGKGHWKGENMKALIVYYSIYGHVHRMKPAVAEGVREVPCAFQGQRRLDGITGCSPCGASTIDGDGGGRQPSQKELDGARWQGRHAATIASKLAA
jgi:hypothetical protein